MTDWRKTSRSQGTNSCVEIWGGLDRIRDSKNPGGPVLRGDITGLVKAVKGGWRKSSRSQASSDCVEVWGGLDRVRDSKNPGGPVLRGDIRALINSVVDQASKR